MALMNGTFKHVLILVNSIFIYFTFFQFFCLIDCFCTNFNEVEFAILINLSG